MNRATQRYRSPPAHAPSTPQKKMMQYARSIAPPCIIQNFNTTNELKDK